MWNQIKVSTYLYENHLLLSCLGRQKKPQDIFVNGSEPWLNSEGKWPLISMLNGGNPRRPGKVSSFHMSMLMAVSPMWPEKVSNSHLVGRRISEWPEKITSVQIYVSIEGSPEWARKNGWVKKIWTIEPMLELWGSWPVFQKHLWCLTHLGKNWIFLG